MQIRMRDGALLHVRQWGNGHPVLVLSGLGMQSSVWWPFLTPFLTPLRANRRYRFILPDARGVGGSADLHFGMSDVFEQHWQDAEDTVKELGLKEFSLIGYSLGASVALHGFSRTGWPGLCRYLHIDQSPSILNRSDWSYGLLGNRQEALFKAFERTESQIADMMQYPTLADLPVSVRHSVLADWQKISQQFFHSPQAARILALARRWPTLLKQGFPMYRIEDMYAYMHSYRHAHDYRSSLAACRVPVTVLAGMRSLLYHPKGQQWMADTLVKGCYERMEGAGHLMALERPVAFCRALQRFLTADL